MAVKKIARGAARKATSALKRVSRADVEKHMKNIQAAVEKHRKEQKFEHFESITPEDLEAKLKRVNSPMIMSQGWGGTTPGGSFGYSVGIYNPDPVAASSVYVHVFVGSGNVVSDNGLFLLNVDERFPRLTEPAAFGLTLAPSTSTNVSFTIKVPSTIDKSRYIGNTAVLQFSPFNDVGKYLDRSVWVFSVT